MFLIKTYFHFVKIRIVSLSKYETTSVLGKNVLNYEKICPHWGQLTRNFAKRCV